MPRYLLSVPEIQRRNNRAYLTIFILVMIKSDITFQFERLSPKLLLEFDHEDKQKQNVKNE